MDAGSAELLLQTNISQGGDRYKERMTVTRVCAGRDTPWQRKSLDHEFAFYLHTFYKELELAGNKMQSLKAGEHDVSHWY